MTQFPTTPRAALALLSLGGALVAAPAFATSLEVSYSISPPDGPSEIEDDIRTDTAPFAEIAYAYAFGIVRSTTTIGPEFYERPDNPGIVVRDFDNATLDEYDEASWIVSASARASRDALSAQALWNQTDGFDGASATAEARSRDVLEIGGGGGGTLTMEFVLSGDVRANVQPEFFGDDLDDVLQIEDVGFRFSAELSRGFDTTRVDDEVKFGGRGIDVRGVNSAVEIVRDRTLTLTREVVGGDVFDLDLYARAFVGTGNARGRAYADFGSTARLSSVALTGGLTLSAESGFDYLALTGEPEEPETPGGGATAVPLPAAGWMLLAGVGALAAARRRLR